MYDLVVIPHEVRAVDTTVLCALLGIDSMEFSKRIRDARIRNGGYRPRYLSRCCLKLYTPV